MVTASPVHCGGALGPTLKNPTDTRNESLS